jgi:hypothetical protein
MRKLQYLNEVLGAESRASDLTAASGQPRHEPANHVHNATNAAAACSWIAAEHMHTAKPLIRIQLSLRADACRLRCTTLFANIALGGLAFRTLW